MITVELDNFSLREICRSGQCFRMHETAESEGHVSECGGTVRKWDPYSATGSLGNDHYFFDLAAE